jgi:hypothetical protein
MTTSVPALCRLLALSLRENVLPHLSDPFARGQLAAALYALASMEAKAGWSYEVLEQWADAREAAVAEANKSISEAGLAPPLFEPFRGTQQDKRIEAADDAICNLFDWLEMRRQPGEPTSKLASIERQLLLRAHEAAQTEKRLVPSSMMRELSGN